MRLRTGQQQPQNPHRQMQTPRSQRVKAIKVDSYQEPRIVMLTKINLYLDWTQAQLPSAVNANRFRCGNVELNRPRCGGLRHRFSSSLLRSSSDGRPRNGTGLRDAWYARHRWRMMMIHGA